MGTSDAESPLASIGTPLLPSRCDDSVHRLASGDAALREQLCSASGSPQELSPPSAAPAAKALSQHAWLRPNRVRGGIWKQAHLSQNGKHSTQVRKNFKSPMEMASGVFVCYRMWALRMYVWAHSRECTGQRYTRHEMFVVAQPK